MGKRKTRTERLRDVYEAEESDPEEEKKLNQRYDVRSFRYSDLAVSTTGSET